jgi:hypothetical protein
MPSPSARVNWYGDQVQVQIGQATRQALLAIGYQIEAQAKVNITNNGQVDTGFMLNSVYTTDGANGSTYGPAERNAGARNPDVSMAPEVDPGEGAVAVAVGAEYAIHQETRNSFLYRAAEQVAGSVAEAEIRQVAKEQGLT